MAAEQQIILRRDRQRIAHEGAGVQDQGAGHAAGYATLCYVSNARVRPVRGNDA